MNPRIPIPDARFLLQYGITGQRASAGPRAHRRNAPGFSIVELLVVLAIGAILLVGAVPAVNSITTGYNITTNAEKVLSTLSVGRQYALSLNANVYAVFYSTTTPTQTGSYFNALQLFEATSANASGYIPLSKPIYMTGTVAMMPYATSHVSTLFNTSGYSLPSTTYTALTGHLPTASLLGSNPTYFAFCFIPDGSTNLTATTGSTTGYPCILIADSRKALPDSTDVAGLNNYSIIQINPFNGVARVFRP